MPTPSSSTPEIERMNGRARGLLLVLCGVIFLEGLDAAMLNVAVPSIRADLGLSTASASWVISAYVLGYAGFLLLGGRAADLLGRRRMFLGSLTVFLLFSGLGGFATEGWMLVAARFATGAAAAFLTPAGLSIITTAFPEGPRRDKALMIYAGTAAGGFSLGVVAGGLLTAAGWRWVFFAPVVLAAALLAAAVPLMRRDPAGRPAPSPSPGPRGLRGLRDFDLAGTASVTGAMLLLVFGVVRLEHPGDGTGLTAGALAAGAALLAVFVAVERRSPAPLVRLGILRSGPLVRANAAAMLLTGAFFGFQFLVTLYLQELRGWSSTQTGLALLVAGVDSVLAPTLTPRLVRRFGNVRVILGGFVLAAVSYSLFLPVGRDWSYAAMFPTMLLTGLAFALTYGPLTIAATDGVAEEEQGLAGGLLNTSFQFGAAFGLSLATAVHGLAAAPGDDTSSDLGAFRAGLAVPVVLAVTAAVVTATGLRRRGGSPGTGRGSRTPAPAEAAEGARTAGAAALGSTGAQR